MRLIWSIAFAMAAAGCASFRAQPVEQPIRVVTYNIQYGAGGLQNVADALRRMNADIVTLQEVDVHWHQRSGFADQASELAASLRMEMRFAPIYRVAGDSGRPMREFGVALLSKHPIESFRNDSLTRLSTQVANPVPALAPGLLNAVVNVGGQRINVLTAHLDYRANPSVRRAQVAEILRLLSDTIPTILAGDFNATPDADELQPLFRRLHDVWLVSSNLGLTFPSAAPAKRIDYILTSGLRAALVEVVPATASDHRPVSASLSIVRR